MTKSFMMRDKSERKLRQIERARKIVYHTKRNEKIYEFVEYCILFGFIILLSVLVVKMHKLAHADDSNIEEAIVISNNLIDTAYDEELPPLVARTTDIIASDIEMIESGMVNPDNFKLVKYESLDTLVQLYMKEKGEEYDIPFEILLAIAKKESGYNYEALSGTGDYGLMQINKSNFTFLRSNGISEWFDPYQSIDAACILINEVRTRYSLSDWHKILMCYNMGYNRASELWEGGVYNTSYSRTVMEYAFTFAKG